MQVVLSQFTRALAESRLMTAAEVRAFIEGLPPEKKPDDGAALAKELVRQKKLTKFQAQAIYQGKTRGLIMGDYVVLDRIGQGGMGQVYLAQHKVMKRVVALKTLPAAATKSDRAIHRFHREVEVAARLSHPNIVTAHDAREDHGVHFLVMEHVSGTDLARLVKKQGRLPVKTALDYILQAARGLKYAHSANVIHRDIKPSNLLLETSGTIKILDMGLARLNVELGPDDSTASETLTGTGDALGTIDYMPPEQAENTKTVDHRADIYSLGCTLYTLLASRPIYSGDTTVVKLLAHREATIPSLCEERPDVPEGLDAVFQKMVAKRPEDRYDSMRDVIADLEKFTGATPDQFEETKQFQAESAQVATLPKEPRDESLPLDFPVISPIDDFRRAHPKPDWKRQLLYASVAVGAFLVVLLGIVLSLRTPDGTLLVEINEADAVVTLSDEKGNVEITRKSGDGPLSISVDPGKHRLKVEKSGFRFFTRDFTIESGGKKVIAARLERLGEKRAVAAKRTTASAPTASVEKVVLPPAQVIRLPLVSATSIDFSPDGSKLAVGAYKKILILETATKEIQRTLVRPSTAASVEFAPNGETLAAIESDAESEESRVVWIWDVRSGELRQKLEGHSDAVRDLAFSPDGSSIATASFDRTIKLWDAGTGELQQTFDAPSSTMSITFCPDASKFVSGGGSGCVTIWDPRGASTTQLQSDITNVNCVAVSPDGSILAVGGMPARSQLSSGQSHNNRIGVWDVATGEHRFTLAGETFSSEEKQHVGVDSLAFSIDGSILASARTDGTIKLWDVGTWQESATLSDHTDDVTGVAFSPDGKLLASCSYDQTVRFWDVSSLGRKQPAVKAVEPPGLVKTLKGLGQICPSVAFSPDGSLLACAVPPYVQLLDTSTWTVKRTLTRDEKIHTKCARFSPDGSLLALNESHDGIGTITVWDVQTLQLQWETKSSQFAGWDLAFSPDGSLLASTSEDSFVWLWDVASGEARGKLPTRQSPVRAIAISPNGSTLACCGLGGPGPELWGIPSAKIQTVLIDPTAEEQNLRTIAFSSDGSLLASDGNVWDLPSGELRQRLESHTGTIWDCMAFSPDGPLIASGNRDGIVNLWNAKTGEEVVAVRAATVTVIDVTFSPNGCLLATGLGDGTVKIWDVAKFLPPKPTFPPLAIAPFDEAQAKQHQQRWAKHLGVPVEVENSVGMEMVLIPPGEFLMGAQDSEEGAEDDEKPQHKVRITKPYYMAAHETTVGQFKAFVEETGYKTDGEFGGRKSTWANPPFQQTDAHPVAYLSWNDAGGFCDWLSKKGNSGYRLPTEAEWEYSCRAGSTTGWCFDDDHESMGGYGWVRQIANGGTNPVGQKSPNAFGLFDVHGNMAEWCSDWYSEDYYGASPVDDPTGPSEGQSRVYRGGDYNNVPRTVRSACRWEISPNYGGFGFRIAQTIPAGKLILEISEPNATISIDDDQSTFTTPDDSRLIETVLTEGKHTVEVSKPGFKTFKKEIDVVADRRLTVPVRLEPAEPAVQAGAPPAKERPESGVKAPAEHSKPKPEPTPESKPKAEKG